MHFEKKSKSIGTSLQKLFKYNDFIRVSMQKRVKICKKYHFYLLDQLFSGARVSRHCVLAFAEEIRPKSQKSAFLN